MSDIASLNREAWNARAKSYNIHPWQQKISSQISTALRDNIKWMSPSLAEKGSDHKLLDYACGTGNITLALQPYISSAVGMDISPQMLEVYAERMAESGIKASTVLGDLASAKETGEVEGGTDFDIAVVGLGFHHFEDPQGCVTRLADRVKSGGAVVIIDWIHDHGHKHEHSHHQQGHQHHGDNDKAEQETEEWKQIKHTIKRPGFDEKGLKEMFEAAGLSDFGFLKMKEVFVLEMNGKRVEKLGFVANGRKAWRR